MGKDEVVGREMEGSSDLFSSTDELDVVYLKLISSVRWRRLSSIP